MLNQRRSLFLEQSYLSLAKVYQAVDLGGLLVEISGDAALFRNWRRLNTYGTNDVLTNIWLTSSITESN
jgi:hypothetical protein